MMNQLDNQRMRACDECASACLQCAAACLREDDPKGMAECIALDMECADLCRLAVACMARGDRRVKDVLALCVQACNECADECAKHEMAHCQTCARRCRHCADVCAGSSTQ